ncbi:helix-turn-helix domain-containing protein [Pseudodonghicola flavimaris]|uniref:AraC family transcriptional regulator n=1 Tax=Pseudodonghicola flavimaris TaxID=3050036 RepID=A0ABT7F2G4_9RHOB|nr:AraC family transcriptional regulator [Pseudodonghicola flavimaris]MDK3018765.1 AraC family transcriptional regulator [Pseudodonghicola flavimaris]
MASLAPFKGLWRQELGGEARTLRNTFRALAAAPEIHAPLSDASQGLFSVRVDIDPADGQGFWRFLSLGDQIYCVITECNYAQPRLEEVRDEGFVEFHFLLEGPVNLGLPDPQDRDDAAVGAPNNAANGAAALAVSEATLIACRSASDVNYTVQCPRGPFRMIGIYVDPALLRESYAFTSATAAQLTGPQPGQISIIEKSLDVDFVRAIQELRLNPFETRRDLMRALAKLQELLCLSADALDSGAAQDSSQVFSQRELEMFEEARDLLATDFTTYYTVSTLSRRLGTNATKLKAGFKFLYGKTIFDFRKAHRMDHAMMLLSERNMTIAEVAASVGYARQASFTAAFKAHFGFLPKVARQMQAGSRPEAAGRD